MDFKKKLSGKALLNSTNDKNKLNIEMESGNAILVNAFHVISKFGHHGIKLTFRNANDPHNSDSGHLEFINTNEGNRFIKSLLKIAYIAKHSNNDEARIAFSKLPNPIDPIMDKNNKPIVFNTNDEFFKIIDKYGQDTTFVWNEDSKQSRTAIKIKNPENYILKLTKTLKLFVGETFYLVLGIDNKGLQRLKAINKKK